MPAKPDIGICALNDNLTAWDCAKILNPQQTYVDVLNDPKDPMIGMRSSHYKLMQNYIKTLKEWIVKGIDKTSVDFPTP